jgi:hypothetical protein
MTHPNRRRDTTMQATNPIQDMLTGLDNAQIRELWTQVDAMAMSPEVSMVRGHLIDELETRNILVWSDEEEDFVFADAA